MKYKGAFIAVIWLVVFGFILQKLRAEDKYDTTCARVNEKPLPLFASVRQAKLQWCATCHANEFKQEMIGPHANAYKNMAQHVASADTSSNYPREYATYLHKKVDVLCITCHASENIYETTLTGVDRESDPHKMTIGRYHSLFSQPTARNDSNAYKSGVDCLTCHGSGNTVVTRADYVQKGVSPPPCNPVASKYFSSQNNCFSCHATNFITTELVQNGSGNFTNNCNSCHGEHDDKGKFTHYYYWQHDDPSKKQNPLLEGLFTSISISKLNDKKFTYSWQKPFMPHGGGDCVEFIATLNFIDNNNDTVLTQTIRLNNKKKHDPVFSFAFSNGMVPGKMGISYDPNSPPINGTINIPAGIVIKKMNVVGYYKSQYWIDDKAATKVFSKIFDL